MGRNLLSFIGETISFKKIKDSKIVSPQGTVNKSLVKGLPGTCVVQVFPCSMAQIPVF